MITLIILLQACSYCSSEQAKAVRLKFSPIHSARVLVSLLRRLDAICESVISKEVSVEGVSAYNLHMGELERFIHNHPDERSFPHAVISSGRNELILAYSHHGCNEVVALCLDPTRDVRKKVE